MTSNKIQGIGLRAQSIGCRGEGLLDPKPYPLHPVLIGRAPAVDRGYRAVPVTEVPAGFPRGTGACLFTAASFRTWRDSQTLLAQDPTIITPITGHRSKASNLGRGFDPARADCGYRAPLTPHLARPSLFLLMATQVAVCRLPSTAWRILQSLDRSDTSEHIRVPRTHEPHRPRCAVDRMGTGYQSSRHYDPSPGRCSGARQPH